MSPSGRILVNDLLKLTVWLLEAILTLDDKSIEGRSLLEATPRSHCGCLLTSGPRLNHCIIIFSLKLFSSSAEITILTCMLASKTLALDTAQADGRTQHSSLGPQPLRLMKLILS